MAGDPKVLVVRFSSIGDIVLTTPVIRALATQANAEVHLVTKRAFASFMEPNPYISQIHAIDRSVEEVAADLAAENYDFVVDLHHNIRSYQVKRAVNTRSASFPKSNIEKWLYVNFRIDLLPDKHIVEKYFEAAIPLGVKYDGGGLDVFVADGETVDIHSATGGLCGANEYVVVVVGAGFRTKSIEPGQLHEIVGTIDAPVVLIGGPGDRDTSAIVDGAKDGIANLVGQLTIPQSASVIRQSRAVLTGDTGMMHVAAAFDRPMVSVWGSTSPIFGFGPFYRDNSSASHHVVEILGLDCRPCGKMGYKSCPLGHFRCMREHNPQHIALLLNGITRG